jgi:acetyl-CoA carboxylase biotin carboxyl carrier protein
MNPLELQHMLASLAQADVREFSLKTPQYEIALKRGAELLSSSGMGSGMGSGMLGFAAPSAPAMAPSSAPLAPSTPATAPEPSSAPVAAPVAAPLEPTAHLTPVKAPIVGTYYSSPSPDAALFVKEGDRIEKGQVLCILEAMKLMNEIESEVAGIVRKILVQNGNPVEYGQDLFLIEA